MGCYGVGVDSARRLSVRAEPLTRWGRAESTRNPIAVHVKFGDDGANAQPGLSQWTATLTLAALQNTPLRHIVVIYLPLSRTTCHSYNWKMVCPQEEMLSFLLYFDGQCGCVGHPSAPSSPSTCRPCCRPVLSAPVANQSCPAARPPAPNWLGSAIPSANICRPGFNQAALMGPVLCRWRSAAPFHRHRAPPPPPPRTVCRPRRIARLMAAIDGSRWTADSTAGWWPRCYIQHIPYTTYSAYSTLHTVHNTHDLWIRYLWMYVCMYVPLYVCMYVCTFVCMHVPLYVCMYVCMYVCKYIVWCSILLLNISCTL